MAAKIRERELDRAAVFETINEVLRANHALSWVSERAWETAGPYRQVEQSDDAGSLCFFRVVDGRGVLVCHWIGYYAKMGGLCRLYAMRFKRMEIENAMAPACGLKQPRKRL